MSKIPKPRPHQKKAIKAVIEGFKAHDRGKLIMACGTGKTLTAGWLRLQLGATRTLLMAPSNALLAQTLQAWRRISTDDFAALAICSDASVADDDMHADEVGATVTTNYQAIAKFLRGHGPRVVLCTYQSSEALALAMSLAGTPAFDFAVADEAHRTTGSKDHLFPTIIDGERIRAAKRLFMTATPRFYAANEEQDVVSMDNEEAYGPTFHELDFAAAIEQKLLTDYEVLIIGVSQEAEAEATKLLKDNPLLKVHDRRLTATSLAAHIAMLRTIKDRGLQRVITFHNSCPKASAAADFLPNLQDWMPEKLRTDVRLWARTINYTLDNSERRDLMRQFVALEGPGVLTNSRCLGEGVDVPAVDGIAFMDAKTSKTDIAQAVGRAIRRSPGKEKSYILLPIFMLPGDDEEQVNGRAFQPALDVINALRAHDSTLMEQLQHWKDRGEHGQRAGGRAPRDVGSKIVFDVPEGCDPKIGEWFISRRLTVTSWDERYRTISVLDKLDKRSHAWLSHQRGRADSGLLPPQRATMIREICARHNLGYATPPLTRLAELEAWIAAKGHRPPATSKLGVFLSSTRNNDTEWAGPAERARLAAAEAAPTAKRKATVDRHQRMADEYDKYIVENGCRPDGRSTLGRWFSTALFYSSGARSTTPIVRDMAWVERVHSLPCHGALTLKQRRADQQILTARKNLAEIRSFCQANGHRPSAGTPDANATRVASMLSNLIRSADPRLASIKKQAEALRDMYPTKSTMGR